MGEPLSTWLALREGADERARADSIARAAAGALPAARPVRCLDLASGTGSNIRYLTTRLPHPQEWLAVDRDPALLALQPGFVRTLRAELGPIEALVPLTDRHLVTASALLDLVSGDWLIRLARACRSAGSVVLFALTYDGRNTCDPAEPEDALVFRLFNQHQMSNDKGFGTAAGPGASALAAACFAKEGYVVRRERSDWHLAPEADGMQRVLIRGWAEAAIEAAPDQSGPIGAWLERRLAHVDAGRSRLSVGHEDLAAWLPRSPA